MNKDLIQRIKKTIEEAIAMKDREAYEHLRKFILTLTTEEKVEAQAFLSKYKKAEELMLRIWKFA